MQSDDAVALIRSAVEGHEGVWVDMGAGRGTFTRALASVLGRDSRVVALERDAASVAEIERWARDEQLPVLPIEADFTKDFALPVREPVAGLLFANSLHFEKEPGPLLARLVAMLSPGGRVVLVEYDRRAASRWPWHHRARATTDAASRRWPAP